MKRGGAARVKRGDLALEIPIAPGAGMVRGWGWDRVAVVSGRG